MGIKFYCPACSDKLNVKEFLAGKQGICPKCNASIKIPRESTRGRGARKEKEADDDEGAEVPDIASMAALGENAGVQHAGVQNASGTFVPSAAAGPEPAPQASVFPATPAPAPVAPAAAPPNSLADPFTAQADASWYVRHPTGGQYGPAKGDAVQRWLGEGRVSGDSLVWCEGWADWKRADSVFPQLAPAPAPAPMMASLGAMPMPGMPMPGALMPGMPMPGGFPGGPVVGVTVISPLGGMAMGGAAPASAPSTVPTYRRKSHTGRYVMISILLIAVLLLVPLLIYVISHQ